MPPLTAPRSRGLLIRSSSSRAVPSMITPGPKLSCAWATVPFPPGTTICSSKPKALTSQSMAAGASRYLRNGNRTWVDVSVFCTIDSSFLLKSGLAFAVFPEMGLGRPLKQLHNVAGRVLDENLRASRAPHDLVSERGSGILESLNTRLDIIDFDHEPIPAARFRLRPVRHRPAGGAARSGQPKREVVEANGREVRAHVPLNGESEVLAVEVQRLLHIINHVPND